MVAGGAVALCGSARDIMVESGISPSHASKMLLPLLNSVVQNLSAVGIPQALTGVARRADDDAIRRHVGALRQIAPHHLGLYLATMRAQIAVARELGELPIETYNQMDDHVKAMQSWCGSS